MRQYSPILLLTLLLTMGRGICAQEVVDRIVARIENDVILLSDLRLLSHYQMFLDGKSEGDRKLLDLLIDQWIVRNEATVSRIAQPTEEDVDKSLARLKRSFSSAEEFEERRKQSGLSEEDLRKMTRSQLYLSNYLDTRFRPAIQIDDKDIEDFYQSRVVPRAGSRGQAPPSREASRDFIQEVLVQRAINEQAEKWLSESRTRVRVDNLLEEGGK